ncbi:MAG: FAD-dependent oxidoreductase [Methylobacteriaceae bacterium]|nr:FAD-dependent oxidoreductase [Methylobacteriaceae bacterium]
MRAPASKASVLRPDLCVVGAGPGGLSVAAGAAALGVSVVLIEKGAMGGDCLNSGCVPSKALAIAARNLVGTRQASRFGLRGSEAEPDFRAVHRGVGDVVAAIAPGDSQARFEALGVKVVRAHGRFTAPDRIEAGGFLIKARRFVVATGSSPSLPPIEGLDLVRYLTNETVFGLDALPQSLIVLGGGAAGLELAQAFRRLGSDVAVLEPQQLLRHEDPELVRIVSMCLVAEGVEVREGATIERVEPRGAGVRVVLRGAAGPDALDASHLLVATDRKPNLDGLGLEAADVAFEETGVRVDDQLRSLSNRRVYAVGDAAGGPQFTHAANHQAGIVLRAALFRLRSRAAAAPVPRAAYTDPEIASVGLTEAEARQRHRDVRILRAGFAENDRARIELDTTGHVKVIATARGDVLGAGIVGANAGELISLWTLAIAKRLKVSDVAGLVVPYPTRSEASRRAALASLGPSLRNPWLRRMLGILRRLG